MHASSSEDLSSLELALGYNFRKKSLLKEALTHKSYAHEHALAPFAYNERMEFLGDAVLELIVSEHLFTTFPDSSEADLSRLKAYIVQESTLAETARALGIGTYLLLGKGEALTGGRKKSSLLADAFEAILAAVYLDSGYRKARDVALHFLAERAQEMFSGNVVYDFKTRLQEVAQARFGVLPRYVTHKEEGPEHRKTFEVKVYIRDILLGSGIGKTKKAAAQKAAEKGLLTIDEEKKADL